VFPEPPFKFVLLYAFDPPPPDPPGLPPVLGPLVPPAPPPADVIVENTEFDPSPGELSVLGWFPLPPPPTVTGKVVAVTVKAPQAAFKGLAVYGPDTAGV
jgi:hypothetical protein